MARPKWAGLRALPVRTRAARNGKALAQGRPRIPKTTPQISIPSPDLSTTAHLQVVLVGGKRGGAARLPGRDAVHVHRRHGVEARARGREVARLDDGDLVRRRESGGGGAGLVLFCVLLGGG